MRRRRQIGIPTSRSPAVGGGFGGGFGGFGRGRGGGGPPAHPRAIAATHARPHHDGRRPLQGQDQGVGCRERGDLPTAARTSCGIRLGSKSSGRTSSPRRLNTPTKRTRTPSCATTTMGWRTRQTPQTYHVDQATCRRSMSQSWPSARKLMSAFPRRASSRKTEC